MIWICAFCSCFSALYLYLLLSHINTKHNGDNNFSAYCGINGCSENFHKPNTFAKHVREKHKPYIYSLRQDVGVQTLENETGKLLNLYTASISFH